jgi:4-aminobutyrate aminotransferase
MKKNSDFQETASWVPEYLVPSLADDWPGLSIAKGEGVYLYTPTGQRYLDFCSGIAVANVGYGHPRVNSAVKKQVDNLYHSSVGITYHEPLFNLVNRLLEVLPTGLDMFYFGNSGTEANEAALKLARYVTRRPGVIAFDGSFHGRSYGAASVTSAKVKYRKHYEPFVPGVYFSPYAYPYRCPLGQDEQTVISWAMSGLEKIFEQYISPEDVAAIIVEPVQGEGGYIIPPVGFLQALRDICDEHQILLIFDEVQTGMGRTGQMFAAQTFSVTPDIMTLAKGIANGFPLSATVGRKEIMSHWSPGSHGTTFGGNPVSCAAAVAVLEIIRDENLLANCRNMGASLLEGLQEITMKYPIIGDVRGIGLMVAMECIIPGPDKKPDGKAAMAILNNCLKRGLICYVAGLHSQVVRLMPPLVVSQKQVSEALTIINDSIAEFMKTN